MSNVIDMSIDKLIEGAVRRDRICVLAALGAVIGTIFAMPPLAVSLVISSAVMFIPAPARI